MANSFIEKLKQVGHDINDDQEEKLIKSILNLVTYLLFICGFAWSLMYLLTGLIPAFYIALFFCISSSTSFFIYSRTRNKNTHIFILLLLVLLLPLSVQFILGGIEASGMIMIWSVISPIGALLFRKKTEAIIWFLVFIILLCLFIYFDKDLALYNKLKISNSLRKTFMLMNLTVVISIVFYSIFHYLNVSSKEKKKNYELLLTSEESRKEIEQKNNQLNKVLHEREILLKEIHHRVKNNMQVITSLLSLQASYINDEPTKALFRYSQYRISSMAIVHEMLYKSNDLSKIKYSDYIERLINQLISSMKGIHHKIKLSLDIPEIYLNIDTAIPLGLLINEIITNALKYGIKKDEAGEIYLKIRNTNMHSYILETGDSGPGFPDDVQFRNTNTLGILLMHNLALQLSGNIEKLNKPGTHYLISFRQIIQTS